MGNLIGLLGYDAQLAFFTGADPVRTGSQHADLVPYGIFPALDGSIVVACLTNAFWVKVCAAIERPECADDPRYDSIQQRRDHRGEVNALVSGYTALHTVADLVSRFTAHEVPHAPILGVGEALAQKRTVARGIVVEVEHAKIGAIPIVNHPFRYADVEQAPPPRRRCWASIPTRCGARCSGRTRRLRASARAARSARCAPRSRTGRCNP